MSYKRLFLTLLSILPILPISFAAKSALMVNDFNKIKGIHKNFDPSSPIYLYRADQGGKVDKSNGECF